ncbi:MAG: CHAT domain-containing protein [Saprospiraceae bacterium]
MISLLPGIIPCCEKNAKAALASNDLALAAKCQLALAYFDVEKGEYSRAFDRLFTVKDKLDTSNNIQFTHLADLHNLLGIIYDRQGYSNLALESYENAIRIYSNLGSSTGQVLLNQANLVKVLAEHGKYERAIALGEAVRTKTVSVPPEDGKGQILATVQNNLGYAKNCRGLGLLSDMRDRSASASCKEAMELFKLNLRIAINIGREEYLTTLVSYIGAASSAGQLDESLRHARLTEPKAEDNILLSAAFFSQRSIIEAKSGNHEAAMPDILKACRILGLTPLGDDSLGRVANPFPAFGSITDTARIRLTALQNKGAVLLLHFKRQGGIEHLEKSLLAYEQAVELYNALQNDLFDDAAVVNLRIQQHTVYPNAARAAALLYTQAVKTTPTTRQMYWEKAFRYAEQGRGFALRQRVRDVIAEQNINYRSFYQQEKDLRDSMFQYRRNRGKYSLVEAKQREIWEFRESLRTSSDPAAREYYRLAYDHAVPTLQELQQDLIGDDTTVFIEYVWAAPQPFALWATRKGYGLVQLDIPNGDVFWDMVKAFQRKQLQSYLAPDANVRKIYDILLGSVLNDVQAQTKAKTDRLKLVIAADNLLRLIPFEALVIKDGRESKDEQPYYVVKKHVVGYQYSAALWRLQTAQQTEQKKKTPKPRIASFVNIADATDGCGGIRDTLPLLGAFSTDTLPALAKKQGIEVEVCDTAQVSDFRREGPVVDVAHFCMHGCLNPENPEETYLSFAPDSGSSGKVSITYLLNNMPQMRAQLAVFGNCNTASQGNTEHDDHEGGQKGEGLIALHWAMSAAGCPNTIATLNEVKDESAALLLRFFFQHLLEKKPADEALSLAKRDYLNKAKNPNLDKYTRHWANFICIGPPYQIK